MDFGVDDFVVVPGCGVGRITAREKMEMEGAAVELFRIDLGDDGERMWVPVNRVTAEGLRPVMTKDRVEKTWEVIESQEAPEKRANWNRRQRRYNEQLMSNEPKEMAELLGELAAVREKKRLSFSEQRLFDKVKKLLVAEIAAALGKGTAAVEKKMAKTLKPAAA